MNFLFKARLKYFSALSLSLVLAGCSTSYMAHKNVRQAEGENTGEVVIFTNLSSDETASVFVNGKFMAALPEYHHVSHKLCEGEYVLSARSVVPQPTSKQKIQRLSGLYPIKVTKDSVQFLALHRTPDGWAFIPSRSVSPSLKYSDPNLIRRIPDTMMNCK